MKKYAAQNIWREICYLLSDSIKSTIKEKDFETQVIRAIEKLGWLEYKNEIQRQPAVRYGRQKTMRPDLAINGPNNNTLVVIEIKKPSEDITRERPADQLISYMLQTKSEFGLLIGDNIRFYYDGKENPQNKPLLLDRIPFEADSEKGKIFVSIFTRDAFLAKEYKRYIKELIEKFTEGYNIKKLREILLEDETVDDCRDFLRDKYSEWGSDVVDGALSGITINILTDDDNDVDNLLFDNKKSSKIRPEESIRKTILAIIEKNKKGVSKSELIQLTGFRHRQVSNALYRLKKMNLINDIKRGIYIAKGKASKIKKEPKKTIAPMSGTVLDKVHKKIKTRKKGFPFGELKDAMGLEDKQLSNALFKLNKKGLIRKIAKGVYVDSHVPIGNIKTTKYIKKNKAQTIPLFETVFKIISKRKKGISIEELKQKTGFKDRQLSNALYKLVKRGRIQSISRGVYSAIN
jgi:predicted transcriptional regulator of viral defense system